jgi:guanyl-specific ribonuclease Sa
LDQLLQAEAALQCGEVPVGCVIVKRDASAATSTSAAVTASLEASPSNADSSSSSLQITSADTSVQQQQQQQSAATVTLPCRAGNAIELVEPDTSAAAGGSSDAGAYASAVVAAGHNETNLTRNVRGYYQYVFIACCERQRLTFEVSEILVSIKGRPSFHSW